jgi:hypothetical protein
VTAFALGGLDALRRSGHPPEICSTSNAKTKGLLLETGPQIPDIAAKHGVNLIAGPFISREHTTVMVVETERADVLDAFLVEARLTQWNQVRILPSHPLPDVMQEQLRPARWCTDRPG